MARPENDNRPWAADRSQQHDDTLKYPTLWNVSARHEYDPTLTLEREAY
jgi:hypothetical protein